MFLSDDDGDKPDGYNLLHCVDYLAFCKIYDFEIGNVRPFLTNNKIKARVPIFILWIYENNLIYKNLDDIIVLYKLENGL